MWGSFPTPAAAAPWGRSVGAGRPGASAAEAAAPRRPACRVGGARRGVRDAAGAALRVGAEAAERGWGRARAALWAAGSGGGCGWRLLPALTGGASVRRWEEAAPACGVAAGVRSDSAAKRRLCLIPR